MAKATEDSKDKTHSRYSSSLIGYEALESELLERIALGRLPQSLLLTGSKGTGKACFAFRLARFLLSHTGAPEIPKAMNLFGEVPLESKGMEISTEHPVFRRVSAESHPDLLVIEPEFDDRKKEYKNEISVDSARKVAEFLSLTPAESLWRVVIIDSVDELNRNAANAILKILEEPPNRSMLILVSHNPARLLPTIRSRCQVLVAPQFTIDQFLAVFRMFDLQLSEHDERALAELSGYSPGRAHTLWLQNAIKAYEQFIKTIVQPSISASSIQLFCDEWCKKEGESRWKMLCWVMDAAFSRILKAPYILQNNEIFLGEKLLLEKLSVSKTIDIWCSIWEKSISLCADTTHIHLDKKLVLFQIFQMMQDETQLAA